MKWILHFIRFQIYTVKGRVGNFREAGHIAFIKQLYHMRSKAKKLTVILKSCNAVSSYKSGILLWLRKWLNQSESWTFYKNVYRW